MANSSLLSLALLRITKPTCEVDLLSDLELKISRKSLEGTEDLHAEVTAPLSFIFSLKGETKVFTVPAGTIFDGASTPNIARSIVPRSGRILYGAAFHDTAYSGCWRITRRTADSLFFDINVAANVTPFRVWVSWLAVRLLGWTRFKPRA